MYPITKRINISLLNDKQFSEILKGSIWALSSRVLATVLGLVFNILVARLYSAEIVGIVAVINSYLMMLTIFTVFGSSTSILRLIPEHLSKYSATSAFKVYRKTQYMVVACSLITGMLFFGGTNFITRVVFLKPHLSHYFAIASLFVVFKSLQMINTQAVRGLRLIRMFALMQILPQVFSLLLFGIIGWVSPGDGVPVYAQLGGFLITGILGSAIMEWAFNNKKRANDTVSKMTTNEIFSISFPMLMTGTMTFFIGQTGVIVLSIFRTDAEVGYYTIAVKLGTLTAFILNAVNSMTAPKFSELYHTNKIDELFYVAKKSAKLIFWTTIPILISMILIGKQLLSFIFGSEFISAYPALIFLVVGQFFHSISGATGIFMNMTDSQSIYRNIMFFVTLINIGMNIIIVPYWGIYGASFTSMISLIGWNSISLIYIKKKYGKTTGYLPLIRQL